MSRVKKVIKNAKIGVFFYIISILVQFFSRKIFLDYLGDDFIGLSTTLNSILGFLNLTELGIGTAIGFTLYKPIFDDNNNEINKIFTFFGYIYRKVGIAIIILGIIISCFFPLIFNDVNFDLGLIYFMFFSFMISSLLGYFFNFHLFLLEADQKGYIVTSYFQFFSLTRVIFQSIISIYFESYILWVLLEVVFSIINTIALRKRIKKEYPWLIINSNSNKEILKDYPELIKTIKQVFAHKLGGFVLSSTDQILIFAFVNLQSVAFFGNYQLIFAKLLGLLNNFFAGTSAGIGNLVAENNPNSIKKIFWEMMALRFFIAGILTVCLYYLMDSFITLWLGEKYILGNSILLLMLANLFMSQIRIPIDNFKQAYGLFADTWAPIAEVILNLGISIVFGKIWGIAGIMLGTFVSISLIVLIWKPYYVYKKGFNISVLFYWKGSIKLIIAFIASIMIIDFLIIDHITMVISNFWDWILFAIKISTITIFLYGLLLFTISVGFRDFLNRIRLLIK
tara:strand:+ start:194 stop:1720 length:1527 start_codon:yes stop_codon:yes gene_type:complete